LYSRQLNMPQSVLICHKTRGTFPFRLNLCVKIIFVLPLRHVPSMNCKLFSSCISFLLSTLLWRFLDFNGGSKIIRTPQRFKMKARVFLSFNRIRRLTPAFARAHGGHSYNSQFSGNESDTTSKTHEGKRITLIGGAVNLGMAIGSASVGYVSGSSSLMAHAVIQLCESIS